MRRLPLALALVLAALLPLVPATAPAAEIEVGMTAGSFTPDIVHVQPGDLVVWVNTDGRAHTVTSAWDDGATFHRVLKPGEEFVARFDGAGEFHVRCVPHSVDGGGAHGGHVGMVMTVQVAGAAPAEPADAGWRLPLMAVAGGALLLGAVGLGLRSGAFRARRTS